MTKFYVTCWICIAGIAILSARSALADTKSGAITLKSYNSPDDTPVTAQLGDKLKVTCKFFIQNFFGTKVIAAQAWVENTGQDPMMFSYNVAFFDADHNLIGTAGQSNFRAAIKPGEKSQMGPIVFLPPELISKVTSYQVTWYETTADHF
jgi:hypothetical protein